MNCDCSRLSYGAQLLAPLECKTILGPFDRGFVLTDVLFDLYNHPNGADSKACGFVWNTLPNKWSRLLFGGTVDDRGRQYHLESGVLCPKGSFLNVCTCYFVYEPTAYLSARVMGCYCEAPPRLIDVSASLLEVVAKVDWKDALPQEALDPIDPTGGARRKPRIVHRDLLGTACEAIAPGTLLIAGTDRDVSLQPSSAVALRVERQSWRWKCEGARIRSGRGPSGTNLLVARRSPDGLLVHWITYREYALESPKQTPKGKA